MSHHVGQLLYETRCRERLCVWKRCWLVGLLVGWFPGAFWHWRSSLINVEVPFLMNGSGFWNLCNFLVLQEPCFLLKLHITEPDALTLNFLLETESWVCALEPLS